MNFPRVAPLLALGALCAWSCHGQGNPNPPAGAASQAEVNAGVSRSKFVSPYTAKFSTVIPAGISNFVFTTLGGTNNGGGTNTPTYALTNVTLWFINPGNSNAIKVSRNGGSVFWQQVTLGSTNNPHDLFGVFQSIVNFYTNVDFRNGLTVSSGTMAGNAGGLSNSVDLVASGTNVSVTPSAGNRIWTITVRDTLNGTNGINGINGTNGFSFPLTNSTVLLTNGTSGAADRAISLVKDWNGTTNLALSFKWNSTVNDFYMDAGAMHFNTFGSSAFTFDQGLFILGPLTAGGDIYMTNATIEPEADNDRFVARDATTGRLKITSYDIKAIPNNFITAPDTVAWDAGAVTLGWPTLYSTFTITSNTWVTGFSGGIAGKTLSAFLTITNGTGTDYTLSVSNSVTSTDGLRTWTVTAGKSRGFGFKVGSQTNASSSPFQ